MTVFKMNLLRIIRKKSNFFSMIIVPAMFTIIMMVSGAVNPEVPKLAVVDNDNTYLTQLFIDNLQKNNEVILFDDEEGGRQALIDREVGYMIFVPVNFTNDILLGNEPMLGGSKIQETSGAFSTNMFIESFMNAVEKIAAASGGNEERFYQGLEEYLRAPFDIAVETFNFDYSRMAMVGGVGFLTLAMLSFSTSLINILIDDKVKKTLHRLVAAPLTLKRYMFENIACFFSVLLIQVTFVFAYLNVYLGIGWRSYFVNLYLLALVFALLSVAFGISIAGIAKSIRQATTAAQLLVTPLVMLGGALWPTEIMPVFMQRLGYLSPVSWFMQAANKIGEGASFLAVYREVGILLLFTVAFFLIGSIKKVDMPS